MNLQEKINHNQNFSEFSETEAINLKKVASFFQDTIHFHPGHLQPKTLIFFYLFIFFFLNNFNYKTITYTTYSTNYTYIVLATWTTDTYTIIIYAYTTYNTYITI